MLMPERISPPGARWAPVSRLPVWELWMPPLRASSLYRPRMKSSFSRMRDERLEHLAQLHLAALALGPPLLAVEAVAGEQARRSAPAARWPRRPLGLRRPRPAAIPATAAPCHADAAQKRATGELVISHEVSVLGLSTVVASVQMDLRMHTCIVTTTFIRASANGASLPRISRNCRLRTIVSTAAEIR